MRYALTAILAAAAALIAVGMLGVASAEAPTVTAVRTVGVEGIGRAPIAQEADAAAANGAYRQAMAGAITDGQDKAQFLASHVGGTLGAVQSVVEENGGVECESEVTEYAQYRGVEPDFGSGRGVVSAPPEAAARSAPSRRSSGGSPGVAHKHRKKKKAKAATVVTCTVTAGVAINYQLD